MAGKVVVVLDQASRHLSAVYSSCALCVCGGLWWEGTAPLGKAFPEGAGDRVLRGADCLGTSSEPQ